MRPILLRKEVSFEAYIPLQSWSMDSIDFMLKSLHIPVGWSLDVEIIHFGHCPTVQVTMFQVTPEEYDAPTE